MADTFLNAPFRRPCLVALAAAALAACAAPADRQLGETGDALTPASILEASPLQGDTAVPAVPPEEILELSPEMIAFIDEHVDRSGNQNERLAQLVYAIIGGDRFELAYDDSTRTARSTFEDRRGNCISFTNLFVAMARSVKLDAEFQEVEIPPDWSMSGETYLLSKHVNAVVRLKGRHPRVIDFNTDDFDLDYEMQEIDDDRARAHYYNNIGVERMLADETEAAYAYLQQSLAEDATFSSAWVNMGILHRREGYPDYAEVAYLKALEYNDSDLLAMSNLAALYQQEGREAEAQFYLDEVKTHRMRNPYYRFQLANTEFHEGDYDSAIRNLKAAIRQREEDDRFYHLLSLSYLMKGDRDEARRWMRKAEEAAQQDAERQKYHHKLDLLRGQQGAY
jgi:tetratricopeptide (TPR) repeat protein